MTQGCVGALIQGCESVYCEAPAGGPICTGATIDATGVDGSLVEDMVVECKLCDDVAIINAKRITCSGFLGGSCSTIEANSCDLETATIDCGNNGCRTGPELTGFTCIGSDCEGLAINKCPTIPTPTVGAEGDPHIKV